MEQEKKEINLGVDLQAIGEEITALGLSLNKLTTAFNTYVNHLREAFEAEKVEDEEAKE